MSDNLRTLGGGGGGAPAIPILKSVIGTAENPKKTLYKLVLFCCVCLLVRQRINTST